MTREQIIAVFGADTKALDQALRAMPQKFAAFGRKSFSSLADTLAAPLTIGGLILAGKQLTDFADSVRRTSEALGVSTDFLQDFYATARNSGSNDRAAEKGLSKLAEYVGEANEKGGEAAEKFARFGISLTNTNGTARNTEEVMRAIADKMRDTQDGTVRATMAVELLGKSGVELIPTLIGGSAAIDEFGASLNKLSEMDLKALDDTRDAIDNIGKSALIAAGRVAGGLIQALQNVKNRKFDWRGFMGDMSKELNFARAGLPVLAVGNMIDSFIERGQKTNFDALPIPAQAGASAAQVKALTLQLTQQKKIYDARMEAERKLREFRETSEQKVLRLKEEIGDLEASMRGQLEEDSKTMTDLANKRLELAQVEKQINAENLAIEKQRAAEIERTNKERADAQRGIAERRGFTIEQLADMPINRNDPYGYWKMGAQEVQNARDAAMDAFDAGDIDGIDRATSYADSIIKQMGDFGGLIKPSELETVGKAVEDLSKQFDILTAPIKSKGALPIIPHNGK